MSRQSVATGIHTYVKANLATAGLGRVERYFPIREPEWNNATAVVWIGDDSETREAFRKKRVTLRCRIVVFYPVAISNDADAQAAQAALDGMYEGIKTLIRNDETLGGAVLQAGEEQLEVHNLEPMTGETTGTIILGGYVAFDVYESITG